MAKQSGLVSIVSELRAERTNLVNQVRQVDAALSVLGKLNGGSSYATTGRRPLSTAARRKISLAQKARWARHAANGNGAAPRPKRVISEAGRRRIAAAQRARWARVKAAAKKS